MTRKSKIARLPRSIRDELNHRLDNGHTGIRLVEWLNSLPETKEILAREFQGHRITQQNLSEWKRGGYRDWLAQQEHAACLQDFLADAKELGEAASPEKLTEAIFTYATVHYAAAMYESFYRPGNRDNLTHWSQMLNDVVRLRNCDLARERFDLDTQKLAFNAEKLEIQTQLAHLRLELDHQRLELARQKAGVQLKEAPNRSAEFSPLQRKIATKLETPAESPDKRTASVPSPPRSGDLSRLGSGERNVGEATGPRGPSERERASQQGRGEEVLRAYGENSSEVGCSKTPLEINTLQPNPTKSNDPFFVFSQTTTVGQTSRLSPCPPLGLAVGEQINANHPPSPSTISGSTEHLLSRRITAKAEAPNTLWLQFSNKGYNFTPRRPSRHNTPNRSVRKLDYDGNMDAQAVPFRFFYMGVPRQAYDDNSLCAAGGSWQYATHHGLNGIRQIQTGRGRLLQRASTSTTELERLKKYCSHSERGFLGFGEALAKEQVQGNPVTELKRSQNPKRPLLSSFQPNGYSIFDNALNQ